MDARQQPAAVAPVSLRASLNDLVNDDIPEMKKINHGYHVFVVVRKLPVRVQRVDSTVVLVDEDVSDPVVCAATKLQEEGLYTFTWVGGLSAPQDLKPSEWEMVNQQLRKRSFVPVFVTKPLWVTFCKQCLWPLMNSQLTARQFNYEEWSAYKEANRTFAEAVVEAVSTFTKQMPETPIMFWIHNYHLMLLPNLLRQNNIHHRIGYFFHTPFPTSELFRVLPMRDKLLRSVLAANFLGFQTYHCVRHFLSSCTRVLFLEVTPKEVRHSGRSTLVGVYPVGTDPDQILRNFDTIQQKADEMKKLFAGTKLIVGRDRLDNLMGIPEKLKAFEMLLKQHPQWQGKVKLFQICLPPADFLGDKNKYKKDFLRRTYSHEALGEEEDLSGVQALRSSINVLVGRINGEYSSADFTPIHFMNRDLDSFEDVAALYAAADAALVTPLREGMNLMSHEFVVCQKENKSPVILSEFTGSAQCLVGSILVNPHDTTGVVAAINHALTMSETEKRFKHEHNWSFIMQNTAHNWGKLFLHDLAEIELCDNVPRLHIDEVISAYKKTRKRILIFDYDGALDSGETDIADPQTSRLMSSLELLCSRPQNRVYVVSQRERSFIEARLGHLPLGLACDNGMFFREYGEGNRWEDMTLNYGTDWKEPILHVLDSWSSHTPGSAIEAKEMAIVWHYKNVLDKDFVEFTLSELLPHLQAIASKLPIEIICGDKFIEVRPQNMNKGAIVRNILCSASAADADFVLCIGNSKTSEEMFNHTSNHCKKECSLNKSTDGQPSKKLSWFTCGVGERETQARFFLPSQSQVVSLVKVLADVSSEKKVYNANRLRAIGRYTSAPTVSNPISCLYHT